MTSYQVITLLLVVAFSFGAIVGSFLNVCIYRVPAGESVVTPRSRCPECGEAIRWYCNIPIVSYFVLRGRCAGCGTKISSRYPLVEALTGGLFAMTLWCFGLSVATLVYWLFLSALVVITFIDLDHQIIPNSVSLPGIIIGVGASFFIPWHHWTDSLLGIALGGGSLWLVAIVYLALTKTEGMGMGDVKLLAMIGAFLGYRSILFIVLAASVAGVLTGIPFMLAKGKGRRMALPFGPFLSFGTVVYLFFGEQLTDWYLNLFTI